MIQSKTYNDHQRMIEQFVNQENLPEALNQYKEALQLNSDPENYSNLGVILVQQGLLEELLSIYPTVIKDELSRKRSYYRLGLSLGEQGLFNEALICFKQSSNKQLNGDKSYDRIWKYLNECDLEEEFNPNHINIELNDTYTYFHEISRYKIINLLSIAEEDKSYVRNQNISLDNLCLILEENLNLEEIYANSVNYNPDKIQKLSKLVNKKSGFTWELLNPKYFQQSLIETGYIHTICPFTGEVLKSNQSFYIQDNTVVPLCFYRFQGREVFYLVVGGWSGGKVAVYFPKTELLVLISNEWGMWLKHEEYLNKFKAHLVSNWQDVKSYISLENKNKKITSISGMIANLGHYFWNELTAIQYLYDNQILDRVDQFLTGSDSRLDLHDLFPEISPEKIHKVENKQDFFQIILKNNLFAVRLTDFSIQESLVQRIYNAAIKNCNEVFLQQIEEAKTHFPLLWINLRGHNKSWISQVEGYANIISELSKEYPNLAIIFDGFSTEKDTMEKIIQQIPSTVKIYDGLNCSIQETLVWAFAIDTYISIIGSGLTLVTWIANKPGVAHSDRAHYSQIQMFAEARDNAIAPSYVPLEYIIDIQDGREGWLNYECDWKAIYNEIVNVIRSLKKSSKQDQQEMNTEIEQEMSELVLEKQTDLTQSELPDSPEDIKTLRYELDQTREELERSQSQLDEVLAELEQAHWQLHKDEDEENKNQENKVEQAVPAPLQQPESRSSEYFKLDLGCGGNKKPGTIGLDYCEIPGVVDHVLNLQTDQLPFPDRSVDYVYSAHCLEHLTESPVHLFKEISRVCVEASRLEFWTSYLWHNSAFIYGHTTYYQEDNYMHLCVWFPDFWSPGLGARWYLKELVYVIEPQILVELYKQKVQLDFAIRYYKGVVHELGAIIEVSHENQGQIIYPQRSFTTNRFAQRFLLQQQSQPLDEIELTQAINWFNGASS
jgi:SAM-dependent methyltransferase